MENSVSLITNTSLNINQGIGRCLQVSGMQVLYNPNEQVGLRIVAIWIEVSPNQWEMLDDQTNYTVSSFHWIWSGGDGYTMISNNRTNSKDTGQTSGIIFLSKLQEGPVTSVEGGRQNTTTLSRRTCLSGPNQFCNGNGVCVLGQCKCTVVGSGGSLCIRGGYGPNGAASSSLALPLALGITLPVVALIFILACFALTAFLLRKRSNSQMGDWEIHFEELELRELLGRGGYGEVRKAVWRGTEVAVKTIYQRCPERSSEKL